MRHPKWEERRIRDVRLRRACQDVRRGERIGETCQIVGSRSPYSSEEQTRPLRALDEFLDQSRFSDSSTSAQQQCSAWATPSTLGLNFGEQTIQHI
jgi:hypothetical protein